MQQTVRLGQALVEERLVLSLSTITSSAVPDSPAVAIALQFGLFHGDPHPGNIFALPDGRIAYCDFGNVAELSSGNKQTLIDAVVHAVNEDYFEMAQDFIKLVRIPARWVSYASRGAACPG